MKKFLAKLFPARFRQRITVQVPAETLERFAGFIQSKQLKAGDRVNLEATSGKFLITFLVVPPQELSTETAAVKKDAVLK